jgi:hypothetical protein
MKNSTFTRFAIHLGALSFLAAAISPALPAESSVHFQLVRDSLIIVSVKANDEGPFYFLLDTGADTTVVDTALAKQLSLAAVQSAQQDTVAGTQTVAVTVLASLTVGQVSVNKLSVLTEDLSSLRRIDRRIDGIVGLNFLSRFNYLLDYRQRTLTIESGTDILDSIDGDKVPQRHMIVETQAEFRGHASLRLQLDSGANGLVLMGTHASALYFPSVQRRVETSATGSTVMNTSHLEHLIVASRQFQDIPVTLAASAPQGRFEDGLLPTSLFSSLYVNNSQNFVIFNPRAK